MLIVDSVQEDENECVRGVRVSHSNKINYNTETLRITKISPKAVAPRSKVPVLLGVP